MNAPDAPSPREYTIRLTPAVAALFDRMLEDVRRLEPMATPELVVERLVFGTVVGYATIAAGAVMETISASVRLTDDQCDESCALVLRSEAAIASPGFEAIESDFSATVRAMTGDFVERLGEVALRNEEGAAGG
jgi:hypothetical protein